MSKRHEPIWNTTEPLDQRGMIPLAAMTFPPRPKRTAARIKGASNLIEKIHGHRADANLRRYSWETGE